MPRIVPLQLLKCLRVLLDDNGGILSAAEVRRIAGLMTKYSKKLVSKCIYVQILKSSKTELLGEFMGVGGWSLVYTWLHDGIRAMNWPLVQEILELLLLCPVDVNRLKINAAPKMVKGLCKDGGNEGVRILAKRLVEQWLKIVTENSGKAVPPQLVGATSQDTAATCATVNTIKDSAGGENGGGGSLDENSDSTNNSDSNTLNYTMTSAQPKANSPTGLVFKFVVNDGQQALKQVDKQQSAGVDQNDTLGSVDADDDSSKTESYEDSEAIDSEATNYSQATVKGKETEIRDSKTAVSKDDGNEKKHKSSRDKDRRSSDKDRRSSSSSHHHHHKSSSSSSHKSSSSSSKISSKTSSSSTSSHRSSSDKHRDKDRERSSKDRVSSGSSSSSKHKSSSSSSSKSSSSSSSSSSSKERSREKDKGAPKKDKERLEDNNDIKVMPPPSSSPASSLKAKDELEMQKPKSITIPSRKASISIEIRRDTDKAKTVKTYNSQFRSHGLTEEAPKPPPRRGLKKPGGTTATSTAAVPGTVIPPTLPSSLKRTSPPPTAKDSTTDKKLKIDMSSVNGVVDKPGAIKLIPPKKIQTLVETNLFSDALAASIEPKKVVKRKRSATSATSPTNKDSPTSPDAPRLTPLKFYQDTLDESKTDDKLDESGVKELDGSSSPSSTADKDCDDDDDIPLKKVKEDIDQKVQKEKKSSADAGDIDLAAADKKNGATVVAVDEEVVEYDDLAIIAPRKPGPGCGPNGPPGVLVLHRRPDRTKKKLKWQTEDKLTDVRYFEIDRSERVNVTKQNFLEMKNLERFRERDALNIARRGFDDNMEPQMDWRPLIEIDNVPPHPNGNQSQQRIEQAQREMTTLRALYFSPQMIPDSPAEAEIELHFTRDVPIIPLEDLTGNPDAINDFTMTPWPEPKGVVVAAHPVEPMLNDNILVGGVGGIGGPAGITGSPMGGEHMMGGIGMNVGPMGGPSMAGPFNPFVNNVGGGGGNMSQPAIMGNGPPPGVWSNQVGPVGGALMGPPVGNLQFNNGPNMNMNPMVSGGGIPNGMMGGPPQNFMASPFGGGGGGGGPDMIGPMGGPMGMNGPGQGPFGPGPQPFNGIPPFAAMGGNGGQAPLMNGPSNHMMNVGGGGGPRNNNRNSGNGGPGGNWRSGGNNFQDNAGGGGGNWRAAVSGPNRGGGGGGGGGGSGGNNGVCKAYMRGRCRLGKSCKYIHPPKNRI